MGLKLASGLAITALFALVYAIIFVIVVTTAGFTVVGLILIIVLTFLIVLAQYALGPLFIGWIYRIHWIPFDDYKHQFPHLAATVEKVCEARKIKIPRLGIIQDLNPNAFCYGWSRNTARLVITEGILKYLDNKEQEAVVGHEMGHIVHNDFIVMTIVFAIPMILYTIARWAYYSARYSSLSSKSDSDSSYITIALYVIGVLSYIAYFIGYLISLLISRIREYYADEYSAEVLEDPNPLSTALVKIAYGLLINGHETDTASSRVRSARSIGIFDPKGAKAFAAVSAGSGGKYSKNAIQAAAAWDLYNPWAKYYQLMSTHPLPAKRIMRLNDLCEIQYNIKPKIDFSKAKQIKEEQAGKSMLPEFLTDLSVKVLPILVLIMMGVLTLFFFFGTIGWLSQYGYGSEIFESNWFWQNIILLWAIGFYLAGFAVIIRTKWMFKSNYKPKTVLELVTNIKVSPVRCEPAVIEGTIVGRGMPGYYFGEDLYFQDGTGLMYIDYRSGIPFGDFFFAIARVKKLVGQQVRITGWYRRGPGPYVQVHRIEVPALDKRFRNFYKNMTYIWAVLAFLVGIVLLYVWWILI